MKVAIMLWFDFNRKNNKTEIEVDHCPHFIEWNYPVLPSTGQFICQPARFLSIKMSETFKKLKISDVYNSKITDPIIEGLLDTRDETLFDRYNDANGDRFIVGDIEWLYTDEIGDYPLIHIHENTTDI